MSENLTKLIKDHLESVNRDYSELKTELANKTKDVVTIDKIEKIELSIDNTQKSIDELNAKINLINTGTQETDSSKNEAIVRDYREILNKKLLRGVSKYDLTESEKTVVSEYNKIARALAVGDANNATGGFLVPSADPTSIVTQVLVRTPAVALSDYAPTSRPDPVAIIQTSNLSFVFEGELSAQSDTTTPTLPEVRGQVGDYEAEPWITEALMADSEIDLVAWINGEMTNQIAFKVGDDFLNGAGTGAGIRGLLAAEVSGVTSSYDVLKRIAATQPTSALSSGGLGFGIDDLFDTLYDIDSRYLMSGSDATIGVNRQTIKTLRKFKDNDGQYLWRPSLEVGAPATFDGVRVVEFPTLAPFTAAGDPVAVIGNFKEAYALRYQPQGVKVMVDNITNKKVVKFYHKERISGFYKDLRALRILTAK